MKKLRPLDRVLEVILDIVPDNDERKRNMTLRFKSITTSYQYAAPEVAPIWWAKAAEYLSEHVGDPAAKGAPVWAQKVADIFSGKLNYEDYR